MITPHNKIEDAINEAEQSASALKPDSMPVTVTNKTLLVLIEVAKEFVPWVKTIPNQAGWYAYRSMETDNEPKAISVYKKNRILMVDCDAGKIPLLDFHHGLTDPEWRSIR